MQINFIDNCKISNILKTFDIKFNNLIEGQFRF